MFVNTGPLFRCDTVFPRGTRLLGRPQLQMATMQMTRGASVPSMFRVDHLIEHPATVPNQLFVRSILERP